jgi:transcriptional regulator GlxA family with amidase domain
MSHPVTRVGILLFDQFDLIDAGGPYEAFLTASRLVERDGGSAIYEVLLISPSGADTVAYGGMTVTGAGTRRQFRPRYFCVHWSVPAQRCWCARRPARDHALGGRRVLGQPGRCLIDDQ